jgi:hypothetical protein
VAPDARATERTENAELTEPAGQSEPVGQAGSGASAERVVTDEPASAAQSRIPRPMPLRPMTAADVLDGSIAIIKAAPRTILAIAAAVVVPLELLTAWLQRQTLSDSGISGAISAASSTSSPLVDVTLSTVALFVLSGIVLSVVAGAIAYVLSAWYGDHDTTAGRALNASVGRLPALALAWLIVHAIEGVGLIGLLVGAVFLMPLFVVVAPAIVVERLGPWRGIRRSMRLTRKRYGAVLGVAVLVAMVDLVLTVALTGIGFVFELFDWGWVVTAICSAGSSLITVPFVAGAATLLYFDLRVRSEGLDLELGIAAHFNGDR